jgi:hypothetical protein
MNFIDADKLSRPIVEIELPLNAGNDINDGTILGDEYIKLFLTQVLVHTVLNARGMKDVPPW